MPKDTTEDERKAKERAKKAKRNAALGLPPPQPRRTFKNDEERKAARAEYRQRYREKLGLPAHEPRRKFTNDEERLEAKRERQRKARTELLLPENAERLAELKERRKAYGAEWRAKRGIPPKQTYANPQEQRAAQAQRARAKLEKRNADAGLPPPRRLRKFASEDERRAALEESAKTHRAAHTARKREAARTRRAEAEQARAEFIRHTQPIISSRIRTRLFIALCEHGPMTVRDIGQYVAPTSGPARRVAMDFFVALGIVAFRKPGTRGHLTYYLNPGHPAHRELLAFGLALARRWPSPLRPARRVEAIPTALPAPKPGKVFPCNFFRREEGNRALLLVAVAGGLTPQVIHQLAILSSWDSADETLRHFQGLGMLAREPVPVGPGAGLGQPQRYYLDPDFFAFQELRALLWTLAATVYDENVGLARAAIFYDPRIAKNLKLFEQQTAHLTQTVL